MAVRFDAVGEHFTRAESPSGNTYTVVAGVKIEVDRNEFSTWVCLDTGATNNYTLMQTDATGTQMQAAEHNTAAVNGPAMTVGTWYRLAVTKAGNGQPITIYWQADGAGTVSSASGTSASNNPAVDVLRIGDSVFGGEFLNGSVAAMKLWSGAVLSQAEIEAEWASLDAVRTTNLWATYKFESGALTTDSSGNARTLSGGVGAAFEADPSWLAAAGSEVSATDGVFLPDATAKALDRLLRDAVLAADDAARLYAFQILDALLVPDTVVDPTTGGTVHTRTVTDGIAFVDPDSRGQEHTQRDTTLLASRRTSLVERLLRDGALLDEARTLDRALSVTDRLVVLDARFTALDRRLLDALLVADATVKTLDRLLVEALLLRDVTTADVVRAGATLYERSAVEALLLLSSDVRDRSYTAAESMLLADAGLRDLTRALLDRLFVVDTTQRAFDRNTLERLLLDETVTRLRELVLEEGLVLRDTAAAVYVAELIEVLVWARLQQVDLLGFVPGVVHFAGFEMAAPHYLGMTAGVALQGTA